MTVSIVKKSNTAIVVNGELIDLVQLWDHYNHSTYGAHPPFQSLQRLTKLVEEGEFKFDYDLQLLLMYLVNWRFYIPNECFKGNSLKFYEVIHRDTKRRGITCIKALADELKGKLIE